MFANACLLLSLIQATPQGADWPHFRGPNRNGWTEALVEWSATGKGKPLWTADVGKGYSCPSIAGKHLVTLGFDEAAKVDRVTCLNGATGKVLWEYEFAAKDKPQYHGGGTLSTPTIAGGRVYCLNRDGMFHVLKLASGTVVWQRDYKKELDHTRMFHGYSSSPLVHGERIYLQLGGLVLAVRKADGAVLWQTDDAGEASHANLLPIMVGEELALATIVHTTFVVLRARDGKRLHEYPWPLQGNAMHCSMPVAVTSNQIFVSTAYNKGCALLQLGDAKEANRMWSNRRMRTKVTACVPYQGHLYGFDESMLRCLDLDGRSKWRVRGLGLGSLSIVDDRMLILTSDGELIVGEASPEEFRELSRQKVLDGGVYWTAPVFANGLIYVRNSLGNLRCLDHRLQAQGEAEESIVRVQPAPDAATLFANHTKLVGGPNAFARVGDTSQEANALQVRGTWSISSGGINDGQMTWTFASRDRWDQRIDENFFCTFDGKGAWAMDSRPRLVLDSELFEYRHLYAFKELLSPTYLPNAQTTAQPVQFAKTLCWQVTSRLPDEGDNQERVVNHYFSVETGHLIGRDGTNQSAIVLHGSQQLAGVRLPKRVTRYCAKDGQEHVMTMQSAKWIAAPDDFFERPTPILRLMRTPAEIARDTAALKAHFRGALARYQAKDTSTPIGDLVVTLRVQDGELWFAPPDEKYRIVTEAPKDGVFAIRGVPDSMSLVVDNKGNATAIKLMMGADGTVLLHRLPE